MYGKCINIVRELVLKLPARVFTMSCKSETVQQKDQVSNSTQIQHKPIFVKYVSYTQRCSMAAMVNILHTSLYVVQDVQDSGWLSDFPKIHFIKLYINTDVCTLKFDPFNDWNLMRTICQVRGLPMKASIHICICNTVVV